MLYNIKSGSDDSKTYKIRHIALKNICTSEKITVYLPSEQKKCSMTGALYNVKNVRNVKNVKNELKTR